ncbi:hypothetical protein [Candidatus Neptunochlamydia vexilliferae]|uniref:Uncharacterized protein n=1 Tax=Candidatus Neptunichlamydia vexilliferae TaxID=1651774 RepID=A0ABS0AZA0_9BACT|nr:hypothetical protein [Candidatus Neptunochlamydia vexilliferae]MBF5058806.1 hypothetical protein [Candidatus Neptunochlamydia vexilliferae]
MVTEINDSVENFDAYNVEEEQGSSWNGRHVTLTAGNNAPNIVLCGENCSAHGDYSFDMNIGEDGLEVEGEVGISSEDRDVRFSVQGGVDVDKDGNANASGGIHLEGSF